MTKFNTIKLLFIGSLIGVGILAGYQNYFQTNRAHIWEIALSNITRKAEEQVRTRGCVDPVLHREMEEYETMSKHGLWCGVVAQDVSKFNAALSYTVCGLPN